MILGAVAIFETMRHAGFPPAVAVTMTAIALRESAGDPNAYNGNSATGDRSYGLLQINMKDPNVAALMARNGIPDDGKALLDPAVNAKAGFLLWSGDNRNLNVAWYIAHGGIYQTRYESHLPVAQAAALLSPLGT
jgi:hypothetical protein